MAYDWLNKNSEIRYQNNSMSLSHCQVNRKDNFGDEALRDITTVALNLDVLLLWYVLYRRVEFNRRKFDCRIFGIAKTCELKIQRKNTIKKEIG